jgi:hypothetical protein
MRYSAPDIEDGKGTARDGGVMFLESIEELEFFRSLLRAQAAVLDARVTRMMKHEKLMGNALEQPALAVVERERAQQLQSKTEEMLAELDGDVSPDSDGGEPAQLRPWAGCFDLPGTRTQAENIRLNALAVSLQRQVDEYRINGVPGVMHEADRAFYSLLLKERDYYKYMARDKVNEDGGPVTGEPELTGGPAGPWARVRSYDVSIWPDEIECLDSETWKLAVEYRGRGLWAVTRGRYTRACLSKAGKWDWEILPSERDDEWLAGHRFTLDEALAVAAEHAPNVTINGMTAAEARERHRQRYPDGKCDG